MHMNKEVVLVKLSDIIPNRFQPRLTFDEEALNELANSIKEHGIIQPLILRSLGNKFEIIAGERRYKAATIAGLTEVPAIIGTMDDQTSAELALIENIQRKDLTAIEEAKSYKKILEMGDFTQDELAKRMGKNQSTIANKMRLLNLTNEAQVALMNNLISERHARCLLQVKDEDKQKEILNKIISERMTVKDTDDYIKTMLGIPHMEQKNHIVNESVSTERPKEELVPTVEGNPAVSPQEDPALSNPNVYTQTKNIDFVNISALNSEDNIPKLEGISSPATSTLANKFNNTIEPQINIANFEPKVEEIKITDEIKKENKFIPNFDIFQNKDEKIPETPIVKEEKSNIFAASDIEPIKEVNIQSSTSEKSIVPKNIRIATAIRLTKDAVEDIKTAGYEVAMEEVDTGSEYQIIIKIKK